MCGQSCFVRSPVLGGLFGVVVPFWNIGVDSFLGLQREHAAKFLWLGAAWRSRGQASPPAHPTNPFMFPNRRPRAAPHSYCSTNACVCLIPETWWQWPPCHEWKKSILTLSFTYVMSFIDFHLKLSLSVMFVFLSPSSCPYSGLCILNYYFLILTFSRSNRPQVFMPHVFFSLSFSIVYHAFFFYPICVLGCGHIGSIRKLVWYPRVPRVTQEVMC